jgi:hypothetical protein
VRCGLLQHEDWESRAVLIPEFLDIEMIELLMDAYANVDSIMRSRLADGSYPSTAWIPSRVAYVDFPTERLVKA